MKIINASIDLNKIDKSRIKTTDKSGKPFSNGAKYYDVTIIVKDEKDQFGNDCSIQQSQTKEEREAKSTILYLGNGKTGWESKPEVHAAVPMDTPHTNSMMNDDELGF